MVNSLNSREVNVAIVEKLKEVNVLSQYKFRDPSTLTEEQLTDPDYRLKQIAKQAGVSTDRIINCSKCHHCR